MAISENLNIFADKTVVNYDPQQSPDPSGNQVYRLSLDYDDEREMSDLIREFVSRIDPARLQALVIGMWGEPYESSADDLLQALVELAPQLPALRALFIGDMSYEECEISWIIQGDYSALLAAYPKLEVLHIRGGNSLTFPATEHQHLRELVIQSGGLPASVLQNLAQSRFPALQHLELWLGSEDYGFDADLSLVQQVAEKLRTPQLEYLALCNSELEDEIAQWLAQQSWVAELATLDLSKGTLSDAGGEALLHSPHIAQLNTLDLSHHYLSDEMMEKLQQLPCQVLLDEQQEADEDDDEVYRYVAVGE